MGETENIKIMAEKLAKDLFSEFFWQKTGPTDENWKCEKAHHKGSKHPADVVFFYDEPYSISRTFIHCDLKSYGRNSISPAAVNKAVESLARQITCAEISDEWRNNYVDPLYTNSWTVCGLLFIYNHDGAYDMDFKKNLDLIKHDKLEIPKGHQLVVLGPEDILWLDMVVTDIQILRGKGSKEGFLDPDNCFFYYPQMQLQTNVQLNNAKAANLEMLTSQFIILKHKNPKVAGREDIILYYRGACESENEFCFIFDYLRHCELLKSDANIQIRSVGSSSQASIYFHRAVQRYGAGNNGRSKGHENNLYDLISKIEYESVKKTVTEFSRIEIGMRDD